MKIMANGKMVDVPTNSQGQASVNAIKNAAGIDPNSLLVKQHGDASNEMIRANQQLNLNPADVFQSMPQHKRGEERLPFYV